MALAEVIKFEGGRDVLVWKHPIEDFNTESQLIVHETQEAIVYKDGKAMDLYKPGRYTLATENVPLAKSFVSLVTGGVSPNHCEVYFVNMANAMNVFWGTTTPLTIQDPVWQVPFKMRAHGQFAVRVLESRKLLAKIIGTTNTFSQKTLTEHFRGLLMSRIKDYISNVMVQQQRSFMEINSYLTDISENIKTNISEIFANYGISIEEFFVESINIEEDEVYDELRKSMGARAKRKMEGYDYRTERGFDVAQAQAKNEGTSGNIAGMGVGLGVGLGAGQVMGGLMGQAMQPVMNAVNSQPFAGTMQADNEFGVLKPKPVSPSVPDAARQACTNCGKLIPMDAAFCNYCGNKVQQKAACVKCKTELALGSLFCHVCGASQKGGQES